MKRHLLTALIIFLLLNFLTVIGGLLNDKYYNDDAGTKYFFSGMPFKAFLVGLFFLTTLIKTRVDISLRLPIIRTILWSVFVIPEFFWQPPLDGEPSMILYLNNGGICSLYNFSLHAFTDNYCIGCNLWRDTVLPGLILFGLFEYLIIKVSDKLSLKITSRKTIATL